MPTHNKLGKHKHIIIIIIITIIIIIITTDTNNNLSPGYTRERLIFIGFSLLFHVPAKPRLRELRGTGLGALVHIFCP